MPLVHATDLIDHARNTGYHVPAFHLASLDHMVPIVEEAEHTATPVILIFSAESGRSFASALAAAVVVAARLRYRW
jgi:fructose/tagatose bisphosphate aldolase